MWHARCQAYIPIGEVSVDLPPKLDQNVTEKCKKMEKIAKIVNDMLYVFFIFNREHVPTVFSSFAILRNKDSLSNIFGKGSDFDTFLKLLKSAQ